MDIQKVLKKKNLTSKEAYYSGIECDDTERLKEAFYSGDLLMGDQKNVSDEEFADLAQEFFDNPDQDFFESLEVAVAKVVGKNNCHRVGGGFGQNHFHISFHFRKSIFWEIMNKLRDYFRYLGIDDIMGFCDNTTPNNEDIKWIKFNKI